MTRTDEYTMCDCKNCVERYESMVVPLTVDELEEAVRSIVKQVRNRILEQLAGTLVPPTYAAPSSRDVAVLLNLPARVLDRLYPKTDPK